MSIQYTQELSATSTKPIIIMAFATWCPHCEKMKPIYKELEQELGNAYIFSEFDIDEFEDLTTQLNVESLPTFIFIKNKQEVTRALGEMPKDDLKNLIETNLK